MIALLSLLKQVRVGKIKELSEEVVNKAVSRIGNWIFLSSILLAVLALILAKLTPLSKNNSGGQVAIGIAAVISLVVAMILTRSNVKAVTKTRKEWSAQ